MSIQNLTIDNFDEFIHQSTTPVLVDFWAPWCGPCRMLSPVVDEIAGEHEGKVTVAKVNIDDDPELASRYGIMSIPSLLVFQNGELRESSVGVIPKDQILKLVELA